MTEYDLYSELITEATRLGHRLFRNNVGVAQYARNGRDWVVPYGIGGKGGSDLIGFTMLPIGITVDARVCLEAHRASCADCERELSEMSKGKCVPAFTAIEVKGPRTKKQKGQDEFIAFVRSFGGIAGVVKSVEDYRKLVGAK